MIDTANMNDEAMRAIIARARELKRRQTDEGPQSKDELWQWVKDNLGYEITRESVCEGHCAPLDFLWDVYSEDIGSVLLIANRGGGKTFFTAMLHYLNSKFKPGCDSLTFAASVEQANRCYEHLIPWLFEHKKDSDGDEKLILKSEVDKSRRGGTAGGGKTRFKNSSKVEAVASSKNAVNGPHPHKAHADEVDLIDPEVWEESRNLAIAGKTSDGRLIRAQDILTSTRKYKNGRVQKLVNDVKEALKRGLKPPHVLKFWCFVETAENQPNCREHPSNVKRKAENDPTLCDCHEVAGKGTDKEGNLRTFDKTCAGRLWYSHGWRPLEEVQNTFQQNVESMWNAQQECKEPETEGNYIKWVESMDEVYNFIPYPEQGPIYMGVDWGGTNAHAVLWIQRLDYAVSVRNSAGEEILMPQDAYVVFDEIYLSEIATHELAGKVIEREVYWRNRLSGWGVKKRFADPQGKADRLAFRDNGLSTEWPVGTRDFGYMLTKVQQAHIDNMLFADPERCPMFVLEIGDWKENPRSNGKELDEFNHAMSAMRYAIANIDRLERREEKKRQSAKVSSMNRVLKRRFRKRHGPMGYNVKANPLSEFGVT